MVKNEKKMKKFYMTVIEKEKLSFQESLKIFDSLYEEAKNLNKFTSENILEGFEVDLEIAKTINGLK